MTRQFLRVALFAGLALMCSSVVVQATTSEQLAAAPTIATLA